MTTHTGCLITQIPKPGEPPAKDEDVYKLVSDLIGGGAAPTSPSPSPTPKPTGPTATEPPKQATPISGGRGRAPKLVVDQLAPVNIRPKVSY